jgi:hypothetical protein
VPLLEAGGATGCTATRMMATRAGGLATGELDATETSAAEAGGAGPLPRGSSVGEDIVAAAAAVEPTAGAAMVDTY